jgi:hypothetical protein
MSVALDLPLEHFDRLFQLRVTLPKRTPAGQPFVRGQTGEPAFVDALAGHKTTRQWFGITAYAQICIGDSSRVFRKTCANGW